MNERWREKRKLERYLQAIRLDYDKDIWEEIRQYCWQLFSKKSVTQEELHLLVSLLSRKSKRKMVEDPTEWEDQILDNQDNTVQRVCSQYEEEDTMIRKIMLGRVQFELYLLFEGFLPERECNVRKNKKERSWSRI